MKNPKLTGVVVSGFFLYPVNFQIVEDALEEVRAKFELPVDLRINEDISVRTEINYIQMHPEVRDAALAPGWQFEGHVSVEISGDFFSGADRKDLTSWRTFTIDTEGSTMFEDALSVEKLSDDPPRYLIGVHITDPLWTLSAFPEIEEEAFRLARTVSH